MWQDEIVLGPLPKGITRSGEGNLKRVRNVLVHNFYMKSSSESSFAFETYEPPGAGGPPHVRTTQDEHIHVLEGIFTVYLDGKWGTAVPGDTVLMPKDLPNVYYNRSEKSTRGLFWESPAGRLAELFEKLLNVSDPEEVVRLSAECDVDFLPAGSIDGA